jgi:hypothetical protein
MGCLFVLQPCRYRDSAENRENLPVTNGNFSCKLNVTRLGDKPNWKTSIYIGVLFGDGTKQMTLTGDFPVI